MDKQRSLSLSKAELGTAVARANHLLPDANAGDPSALADLRTILDDHPQLWEGVGNLAREAELTLVRLVAGPNTVTKEALRRKLDALRLEVAGSAPSPLERLLADRVVLGWLGLAVAEGHYHRALDHGLSQSDDEFHQRRVERAQRRYLTAIKALAQVRRLGVPAVQVNIADKQINVTK
ncbi:MAG: hypothetical protein M3Q71_17185 [Chloroflexota bacterium]|nr:hypothetical protein [Chloroflexota bacterium]